MKPMTIHSRRWRQGRRWLLSFAGVLLLARAGAVVAQDKAAAPSPSGSASAAADTAKLPMGQIEALVAPIALYPDPLLAQTLVAATYPLEIIQLEQWMAKHPGLKDKALADSVAKQPWDPSIQSMAVLPDVVKRLADDIQWTTELGNAFLAQQTDVMDAVQALRKKAIEKGALTSNEQQKVDTQVVEKQTVIVVQPANPDVVYVPVYTPTVVYGPPAYYPYPPIYYPPPPPPGAYFVAFTAAVVWRSAVWGGSCCYAGWGHGGGNTVIINNNNNFNQINHYGGGGNNNWQHNPSHRGGAPYPNQNVSNKYGGGQGQRGGGASASTRPAGGAGGAAGGRPTAGTQPAGGAGGRAPSAGTQPAGGAGGRAPSAGTQPAGGAGARVPNASTQPSRGTPSNQVGSRDVPSSRGGQSGFSGGQGGYSGANARASSSRGASSMGSSSYGGSRGGGGGSRGGGGRR